jgi:hypothetical protein
MTQNVFNPLLDICSNLHWACNISNIDVFDAAGETIARVVKPRRAAKQSSVPQAPLS